VAPLNVLQRLTRSVDSVVAVALQGDNIAVASAHGKVRIWDRRSGTAVMQDDTLSSNLCRQGLRGGIDMHEDGTVVVCWKEGYATVWDSKTATPQFVVTTGFSAGACCSVRLEHGLIKESSKSGHAVAFV